MSTLSTTSLNWLAKEWAKSYKTAVLSGIVGDLAHKARGGYHISREDQGKSNYSVVRADDKPGNGPSDRAAAIDMTMSTADIVKCHTRLRDIWKNRAKDPRMKYINAWNGWDGNGGAGRYDVVTGNVGTATADHKWHIHLEIRRKYVNDMTAMKAILSMLKGESLDTYQKETNPPKTTTPVPAPVVNKPTDQGDDVTPADIQAIANAVWDKAYGTASTKTRFNKDSDPTRNYLMLSAIYSLDAAKGINALSATVAKIAEKVDLDPAEIQALKNAIAVPTAQQNADAVVLALGGRSAEELSEILTGILGPEKTAALKAAL